MLVSVFAVRTIRAGDMKPSGGGVDVGLGVAAGGKGTDGVEGCGNGGGRCETVFSGVGWQHRHLELPFGFLVLNGEASQRAAATLQN